MNVDYSNIYSHCNYPFVRSPFLYHKMHNLQSFLETSTKVLPWINWDLTVSSHSQLYLIRSLLSGIFRGANMVPSSPPNFSKKSLSTTKNKQSPTELFVLAGGIKLLPNWLLVWSSKTSLPQDHGSWTDSYQ